MLLFSTIRIGHGINCRDIALLVRDVSIFTQQILVSRAGQRRIAAPSNSSAMTTTADGKTVMPSRPQRFMTKPNIPASRHGVGDSVHGGCVVFGNTCIGQGIRRLDGNFLVGFAPWLRGS
jgi:hypothetical protein